MSNSLSFRYRRWAARLVLGTLLVCSGCKATFEVGRPSSSEPTTGYLPPVVRTETQSRPEVKLAAVSPTGTTSREVTRLSQPEPTSGFLPPVVKTEQPSRPHEVKTTATPVTSTSQWAKRPTDGEDQTLITQVVAEKSDTEVVAIEPALMPSLPSLAEGEKQAKPGETTPEYDQDRKPPQPVEPKGKEPAPTEKMEPAMPKNEDLQLPPELLPGTPIPLELSAGQLLTLEEAENLARAGNPALLQAGEALEKARGYHLQLGLRPNPQVGYTASEIFNEGHAGQQGVYYNQTFVRGNKQELDQEVLCREIMRLEWEYRAQEARLVTDVRRQYYAVLGSQRRVELLKKLEDSVLKAAEGLKKLVEAGETPEVDYLQINLLASELKLKRENAEIELIAGRNQLAALMSKPDLSIGEVAGDLEANVSAADLETMFTQLLANSPQIQAANGRIARAQAMIARQERQNVPNLQAQTALLQDTSTNHTVVNLQLGVDLPYRNRNQGNIVAAVADYRRAVEQKRQLELSLRAQLAETLGQLQQAENSVRIYRDSIVPQSEQNLTKVKTAFDAGEMDLTRLFVAQRGNVEASLELITAQVNHRQLQALVDGALLSGGLLNEVDTEVDSSLRGATLDGQ